MNKLEQLHLDAINNNICSESNYTKILGKNEAASKSAEITEQIAIEFWAWMRENDTPENAEMYGNFTDKDLFQEFLKTKQ